MRYLDHNSKTRSILLGETNQTRTNWFLSKKKDLLDRICNILGWDQYSTKLLLKIILSATALMIN